MRPLHLHTICGGQRKGMIAWAGFAAGPNHPGAECYLLSRATSTFTFFFSGPLLYYS